MRIGIIIGSTRPGRFGEQVGRWVHEQTADRDDADYELLDVAEFDLRLLDDPIVPGAANREYQSPATRRWSETVDGFDGFVFVTAEYNHGVPAALKNAVDVLFPEWGNKAVLFVGYGSVGGVRAVEQWRQIVANLSLYAVRAQLDLSTFADVTDGRLTPGERRADELSAGLDQLVALAGALAPLRRGGDA